MVYGKKLRLSFTTTSTGAASVSIESCQLELLRSLSTYRSPSGPIGMILRSALLFAWAADSDVIFGQRLGAVEAPSLLLEALLVGRHLLALAAFALGAISLELVSVEVAVRKTFVAREAHSHGVESTSSSWEKQDDVRL
jgi:hypothetical protein